MKPNMFIVGPSATPRVVKFRVHGENDWIYATAYEPPKPPTDHWYIDLSLERDATSAFQYNSTTKELTELRLPDIMNLLKLSDF